MPGRPFWTEWCYNSLFVIFPIFRTPGVTAVISSPDFYNTILAAITPRTLRVEIAKMTAITQATLKFSISKNLGLEPRGVIAVVLAISIFKVRGVITAKMLVL